MMITERIRQFLNWIDPPCPYNSPDKIDTLEDVTLSARICVGVVGELIPDHKGIVIELKQQENYPSEPYGKYVVFSLDDQIMVEEYYGDAAHGDGMEIDS